MTQNIKERLNAGQQAFVLGLGAFASPKLVEMAGVHANIQGVWLDQEHSAITKPQLELLVMACRAAGLDAFSRLAPTDYTAVMHPYEAGCSGIMIAQIRTLDEVREVVSWSKYPPVGRRGVFGSNPESRFGQVPIAEYLESANRDRWLAIQIETAESVEIVDEIAATDGVDMLIVGPSDLSCNLGVPGDLLHANCRDALQRVATACRTADIPWGIVSHTLELAQHCHQLGCRLFSLHNDANSLRIGISALNERVSALES